MNDAEVPVSAVATELEKYKRLFRATPDYATFSHLQTGIFIDVNPGFERLTGYARNEVIGRTSGSIDLWVHAGHRETVVRVLRDAESFSIETQFRNRHGEIFDVDASLSKFVMNGEDLLVAIVRDVTTRKRQELELEHYRSSLEKLVEQRTRELESAMRKLQELATHDELTGIGNRRDLNVHLDLEYQAFKRLGMPTSVAVFDLDHFKAVNDRRGHAVGDEVIRIFAQIIRREMRAVDYVARYGGDEFVLILKGIRAEEALTPLNRIREAVHAYPWTTVTVDIRLTTSIGVASFYESETADDTFRRADKALYNAKIAGRDCIVIGDAPET